jgi:hypothetical protein
MKTAIRMLQARPQRFALDPSALELATATYVRAIMSVLSPCPYTALKSIVIMLLSSLQVPQLWLCSHTSHSTVKRNTASKCLSSRCAFPGPNSPHQC